MTAGRVATSLTAIAACWLILQQTAAGQIPPYGGATEYVQDLAARRAALARHLPANSIVVFFSAPTRVYSGDTDYEFRQDSNLLYLTGLDQGDTTLVMATTETGTESVLFVRAGDPFRELWYGHTFTPPEVTARSGIATVVTQRGHEAFDAFIEAALGARRPLAAPLEGLAHAMKISGLQLGIVDRVPDASAAIAGSPVSESTQWALTRQQAARGLTLFSVADILDSLRAIKTPYEQRVLRRSVEISAEAHVEGMRATKPNRWEYEVEAAIEFWFHRNGAESPGYPSIVGSGPNATTLHYLKSDRQMRAGELLLVDAAASFQGLTGDITRTYPVSGKYSAAQRALYDVVLRAQEAGMAAARPGARPTDVTAAVRRSIGADLLRLGLVFDPAAATGASPEIDWWFPHGPIHGIGMDVHDALGPLDPGAAFVIEPGLYFRRDVLDRLASDPATRPQASAVATAVARYLGMGIRVEDSFLMTAAGPEMLSARAPRQVSAIEAVVGRGR